MSGLGNVDGHSEAEVMAGIARSAGVSAGDIMIEGRSRNTFENIRNSSSMLSDYRLERIMLVTDDWHMKRALMCCHCVGLAVSPEPLPTPLMTLSGISHRLREVPARIKYRFMLPRWCADTNLSGQ
jgi:uncharacterized SAM-binding protein YcdF (DUF218 family)